jgi:hypothetical protein
MAILHADHAATLRQLIHQEEGGVAYYVTRSSMTKEGKA